MIRNGLIFLVAGVATPALAQADRASAPWSQLEYKFAAQCIWVKHPAEAQKLSDLAFADPDPNKTVAADFADCTSIDGLAGRDFDHQRVAAQIAFAALRKAADCALDKSGISKSELGEISVNKPLPVKVEAGLKKCNPKLSGQAKSSSLTMRALQSAFSEQLNWRQTLSAWDADPLKQSEIAKRAGCVWRKNEMAARQFLITVGYGKSGTKLDRLVAAYPSTVVPCLAGTDADSLDPKQVFIEIVNLGAYNSRGAS